MFRGIQGLIVAAVIGVHPGVFAMEARRFETDVHSSSRPNEIRVERVEVDLVADFERRVLEGTATLIIRRGSDAPSDARLVLDGRDLTIESAEAAGPGETFRPTNFDVTRPDTVLGQKIAVQVRPQDDRVRIAYRTSPQASALQWLEPALTAGKSKPFLFTQSQAIHARSWIPLQDSPGVRITYAASVSVPKGLTAVMSAETVERREAGDRSVFRFEMDRAIPPYLIALGVGELEFRELGPRTGVYAEPALLAKSAAEFVDTEKMVEAVEKRFGPYRWGRYDILVLPPSFPFGGMENPRLTFATPTILAGDRSLVSLIAHELAHSWSGNLVTNATWRDFWLNEGFTTYLERRIVEDLYGRERAEIEAVLGLRDLREELASLPPADQRLHIDLAGRDPDEGVTRIPYEKGALFLRTLEERFGRTEFDRFLLDWFESHAFRSLTTADFVAALRERLFSKNPEAASKIALDTWLEAPGLPEDHARPESKALVAVEEIARKWLGGAPIDSDLAAKWSTQEWLHFLQSLPADLSGARMDELDRAFRLTERENSEIAAQWLLMSIRADHAPARERLRRYLVGIGRRKLIVPLYKELMKTEAGRARAKAIYAQARPGYHPIAVDTLDAIIGRP